MMRGQEHLRRLLALVDTHRARLPWLLALVALVVCLPSVPGGFSLDDRYFQLVLDRFPHLPGVTMPPLDTFVFADGDAGQNSVRRDLGLLPWWTPDTFKLAFWRPLASVTHWLDWRLFGNHAWPMHLINAVLYAALVLFLIRLYGRFLTPVWVGFLAGLFYLLDDAHGMAVGWLANRNGLLSALFAVGVLYFHDRWRRDGWNRGLALALACLALGLVSGESAIGVGGYLLSHAIFMEQTPWRRRLLPLLPYAGVVVLWRLVYSGLGYGTVGSLFYIDPSADKIYFLANAAMRIPILLFTQFFGFEAMLWNLLPPGCALAALAAAAAVLLWMTRMLWPMLAASPVARFWALGALVSCIPCCASIPQSRLLLIPGIGVMGLMAMFFGFRADPGGAARETPLYRVMAQALLVVWFSLHLVMSMFSMPVSTCGAAFIEGKVERQTAGISGDPALSTSTLVIVNAPVDMWGAYFSVRQAALDKPVPRYSRELFAGCPSLEATRLDDRTLLVKPDDTFLRTAWSAFFRNPVTHPMVSGDTVDLTGLHIEVKSAGKDGRPQSVAFSFDRPLEDPSLRWVTYGPAGLVPFDLPQIGETVRVKGLSFADIAWAAVVFYVSGAD